MKEVIFKQISIRNFLSIGNEPVDIKFNPGIHIITGINKDKEDSKNGVGKSTIADAVFFAIFGSPLRPIKKEVITNWINKKECSVTITFQVINDGQISEYILLRSLNPSRVQLLKDGEDISRTIGKTNETIYEILGTTAEMFEQSVIMSLNEVEPFLSKTPAVKRKFIEDIFKIEIFGAMTQYMRNDYNETKQLFDSENQKLIDMDNNIEFFKKQQNEQQEKKKNKLIELNNRKKDIIEEMERIQININDCKNKINEENNTAIKEDLTQKINTLKTKLNEITVLDKQYTKEIAVNQNSILNIRNKIKELEELSEGVCAYCKQPFSESNIQAKKQLIKDNQIKMAECENIVNDVQEKIKNIEKSKLSIDGLIAELNTQKQEIEKKEQEIEKIKFELSKTNSELQKQIKWLKQVDDDINSLNTDDGSFINGINELNTRKETILSIFNGYKNKLALIETSKFIVSDEGVKNFIIKKMLKMLNGRLNYYLKQLDANCTCQFDEYFDENIVNNRGRECSYFNFSGGERKRIDLAMLFTFMDIRRLQSNIAVNIGIYDELLDTSIDSKGIESTLTILKERVLNNKEAIYVISHKNEAAKHATGEIIYLEKENDITKRKPYEQIYANTTLSTS